jgi:DNA repair protein SbcC/Rad50
MLLQRLKLNNIRSYIDETISFSSGSTLLSGDIGSGKSTTLLAIEFALFGTSRPDLPGECLLRKGASQGSVELTFKIDDQEIIITRNLKKDKDSIKQIAGHIINNGIKKELTPLELKAEIINLLGYPEEFITKNKNYIFRYTVYTPQEDMKFILQENPDLRLDVLRKIFNIDKYKNIRDNIYYYLKQVRTKIAVANTKLEPFEEYKQHMEELNQEKKRYSLEMQDVLPKLEKVRSSLNEQKDYLEKIEKEQQTHLNLKNNYKTTSLLINEKKESLQQLKDKCEKLNLQLVDLSIPDNTNHEQVKEEIVEIESQKNKILENKTKYETKLSQLQELIKKEQQNMAIVKVELEDIETKRKEVIALQESVSKKEEIKHKKEQFDDLFEKTTSLIVKNQTILNQSRELQNKIVSLDNCPTCLQLVSDNHKNKIDLQEKQKITHAESLLSELNQKKMEITSQRERLTDEMESILVKENSLTKLNLQLLQLEELQQNFAEKEESLKSTVRENNLLMQQLNDLEKENTLQLLEQNLFKLRNCLELFSKRNFLQQHVKEIELFLIDTNKQLSKLQEDLQGIEEQLSDKIDFTEKISVVKIDVMELITQEKEIAVKEAELRTSINNLNRQEEHLKNKIDLLNEEKSKLLRLKELYHWLDAHFLKLTYTIEKQVMLNIHHLFDKLFQEWFSILIEDDNIYSRIDDSFTPIIEQNGYEISFNNLSGGEKTSAALAYRLSLNRVINDVIHQIKTKNLLILDEPTDGFSNEQLDKVRDVLERLNLKQTILVSHESKIESFVNSIVRINKESHISKVY